MSGDPSESVTPREPLVLILDVPIHLEYIWNKTSKTHPLVLQMVQPQLRTEHGSNVSNF